MNDDYIREIRDRFGRKDSRRRVSSTEFHSHPAEPMESPLEVLSRAATMVQDKATSGMEFVAFKCGRAAVGAPLLH